MIKRILITIIACLTLLSCETKTEVAPFTIKVSPVKTTFWSGETNKFITVVTNAPSWQVKFVKEQPEWCEFKIKGNKVEVMVTSPNKDTESRITKLEFYSDNMESKFVNITQEPEDVELTVEPSALSYESTDTGKDINVITNQDSWSYTIVAFDQTTTDVSWCTAVKVSDKLTVTCAVNKNTVERKAKVVITVGDVSREVILTQNAFAGNSYKIIIPDLSQSLVYYAYDNNGEKCAEITREFLRRSPVGMELELKMQAVVVYPVVDNVTLLDKGFIAQVMKQTINGTTVTYNVDGANIHCGSVGFDKVTNSISSYKSGNKSSVSIVYMSPLNVVSENVVSDALDAKVEPDILTDVRGNETNKYQIVKIGTQYWIRSNLRTTKFTDGTDIERAATKYDANLNTSFYSWYVSTYPVFDITEDIEKQEKFGAMYSYAVIKSTKSIAPSGWKIPTAKTDKLDATSDFGSLLLYLGATSSLTDVSGVYLKSVDVALSGKNDPANSFWNYNATTFGNDFTGFSLRPSGYRTNVLGGLGAGGFGSLWVISNADNIKESIIQATPAGTRLMYNTAATVEMSASLRLLRK